MRRGMWILAIALAFSTTLIRADEPVRAVGFIIENSEHDLPHNVQRTRDGKTEDVGEGDVVLAGDVLKTDDQSEIAVAFVDNSAITLRKSTTLKIDDYAYPAKLAPTHITLEEGRAFFSVNPRPDAAHFFIASKFSNVEVKGTKFEIYNTLNSDKATYTTTVGVTEGTVTLKGNTGGGTDIFDGTTLAFSIGNKTVPPAPATLEKGNIDSATLKTLKATAVEGVQVSIKNGKVTVTSILRDAGDGSTTTMKDTTVDGAATGAAFTVKDSSNKTVETYSETAKGVKLTKKIGNGKLTATAKGKIGTVRTGKATFVDPDTKEKFTGDATFGASTLSRAQNSDTNFQFTGTTKNGDGLILIHNKDGSLLQSFCTAAQAQAFNAGQPVSGLNFTLTYTVSGQTITEFGTGTLSESVGGGISNTKQFIDVTKTTVSGIKTPDLPTLISPFIPVSQ